MRWDAMRCDEMTELSGEMGLHRRGPASSAGKRWIQFQTVANFALLMNGFGQEATETERERVRTAIVVGIIAIRVQPFSTAMTVSVGILVLLLPTQSLLTPSILRWQGSQSAAASSSYSLHKC